MSAGGAVPAKRLPSPEPGSFPDGWKSTGTSYWKAEGVWHLWLPGGGYGHLANHQVEEHDDGTITVSPSILITGGNTHRHGYLKRGVWEPCGDDRAPEGLS